MMLSFQVLGEAGRDNALLVKIDSGQAVSRLLFDYGESCLSLPPISEVQAIFTPVGTHTDHLDLCL
jgi:ribonuclease Z